MPSFFQFTQGTESRERPTSDASPLLGRFRAVPPPPLTRRPSAGALGLLSSALGNGRGSVHGGYGALLAAELENEDAARRALAGDFGDDDDDNDDGGRRTSRGRTWRRIWRKTVDLWFEPRQAAVKRVVDVWWSRYFVLVILPATLAVAWCAVPFPKYPLPDDGETDDGNRQKVPGHGHPRVQVNFWFFLFVYYGFYNVVALIYITKVFNLYSLNWWPSSLGFPITVSLIAIFSIAVPIPVFLSPETRFLTLHNTTWISWSFMVMAAPVAIAFCILLTGRRHLSLQNSLSDTQRIFTSSWWTGDQASDGPSADRYDDSYYYYNRRRLYQPPAGASSAAAVVSSDAASSIFFDSEDPSVLDIDGPGARRQQQKRRPLAARVGIGVGVGVRMRMRRQWLPASFVRFIWFCLALFVGLLAYVLGEAYAEIYLRTLPHDNFETVFYVYSWVGTVHLLDALTGWLLGLREGERVGSYPLSWVFKLYFMLTYQTYVRALYARLRSPQQFVMLQLISSSLLIVLTPVLMSRPWHRLMRALRFTTLSYASFQKIQTRNVFIRFLAENVSMACFLGSVLVLHFGANKDVYPYFAFDNFGEDGYEPYDFDLTFYASSVTWACELAAALCVRGLTRWIYRVDIDMEGKLDLAVWPELLPTSVAVTLHVLQNMLFSIIRLQFRA
ncbi:hypothetical protein SODALDRAFT_358102 [Sodiomyces alkalinus F11]|uniref:Uncharacterized protein n=1 Tax=Sodiomyces alkalinus (strain CBS 110278 / VKM F-3762 / F11) TaxID=1314773 RepID=A0A3N2PYX1_SODAK|nr:hypothetical protein SODALDRAFT_358102 [Sodiomyces alkalinus F11]ROT39694.1 hypothetical protein SODALDRAFT_358102 [Sodiomyces alkalinus F11]